MPVVGVPPPAPGKSVRVLVNGTPVAVFNVAGTLHAIDATCPHAGGPLEEGALDGTTVTCPWHGSKFDLTSGAVVQGPARRPVKAYRVRSDPGGVAIDPVTG